ncbi:MAG: heavy metal-binding domain-containing protein [Planctomycetota bacterium]|jgi:YHS domain-containing protein
MLKNRPFKTVVIIAIGAFSLLSTTVTDASAQTMHQPAGHYGHQHDAHSARPQSPQVGQQHHGLPPAGTKAAPAARPTPHGGQISVVEPLRFEVVYLPRETRVYLYDASNRPISAKGAAGRVAMKVRGYEKTYRYPLTYVPTQAGTRAQDYLVLVVNQSRIKDGDMSVTFEMTKLPSREQPRATFTQTFALSKIPVRLAALTEADRAGVARQKVCPVMGGKLGSMGTPVKVLLGDHPIYLCCKGCLGKVRKDPAAFLPKSIPAQPVWTCSMHPQVKQPKQGKCPICGMGLIPMKSQSGGHGGHAASTPRGTEVADEMTVSTATAADQAAIRAQRVCAVSGSRLGGMGTPVKVTIHGQSIYLCCEGCLGRVKKDPQRYLAKAAQLRAGR